LDPKDAQVLGSAIHKAARLLLRLVGRSEAPDCLQELAMRVFQHSHRVLEADSPTKYACGMALSLVYDLSRNKRRRRELMDQFELDVERSCFGAPPTAPDETGDWHERRERFGRALAALPADERTALLTWFESETIGTAAAALGWTYARCRSAVSRAKRHLIESLRAPTTKVLPAKGKSPPPDPGPGPKKCDDPRVGPTLRKEEK
jgi:RNA polymerase sigma factor (sigma-70 family)